MNIHIRRGTGIYKELARANGDINFRDAYNHNALHGAAIFGNAQMVEDLVKQGLNIDERNKLGQTAFILAARNPTNGLEIIRKLKELGADIFAIDNNGTNALHIALHGKNSALINELKKYGLSNKLFIPTNIKSK